MHGEIEKTEFLAGSEARIEILELLRQNRGMKERDLRERIDYSRTTVYRNLDSLLEKKWIQNSNRKYSVTTSGEIVAEKFIDLMETTEAVSQLQPFLQWVPRDALDIDVALLRDAEITTGETCNPLAMVNRHVQQLKETTEAQALLPTTGLHPYEVAHERTLNGELEAELVVEPGVAETFRSNPDFEDLTHDMLNTGRLDIYIYEGSIPYYLGVLDETVQLGADEEGEPKALVETQSDQVRRWAENKFSEYRREARKVS